jgi:hypothetical protein
MEKYTFPQTHVAAPDGTAINVDMVTLWLFRTKRLDHWLTDFYSILYGMAVGAGHRARKLNGIQNNATWYDTSIFIHPLYYTWSASRRC